MQRNYNAPNSVMQRNNSGNGHKLCSLRPKRIISTISPIVLQRFTQIYNFLGNRATITLRSNIFETFVSAARGGLTTERDGTREEHRATSPGLPVGKNKGCALARCQPNWLGPNLLQQIGDRYLSQHLMLTGPQARGHRSRNVPRRTGNRVVPGNVRGTWITRWNMDILQYSECIWANEFYCKLIEKFFYVTSHYSSATHSNCSCSVNSIENKHICERFSETIVPLKCLVTHLETK